ncbi:MAG: S8 family serine peptidase [Anaerolineae bacterium]|nr:S8 family serine peptidase [Anaerolineae bacterium]
MNARRLAGLFVILAALLGFLPVTDAAFVAVSPTPAGEAPAAQIDVNCTLLDDPHTRGMMSFALEQKLLLLCGRLQDSPRGGTAAPVADGEILRSDDVLVNDPAGDVGLSTTQSGTTIAVNPDTGVVCSAYNDSQHWAEGNVSFTGFSRSVDGGASFVDRGPFPIGDGGSSMGLPSLSWRDADGYFYYLSLHTSGLGLWRSTDDCNTFSFYNVIHVGPYDDKAMMVVDNNLASPYYGRFYVAWTDFSDGRIYLIYSDDGIAWSPPLALSVIGADVQGAWPAVAPNGDVYVAWLRWNPYPNGPIAVEMVSSADGGNSFSFASSPMVGQVNPRDSFATALCGRPALNGEIRYAPFPQIAIGPDGCIHAVYSYDPDGFNFGDVVNVYYRRSCDGGMSWSAELQLNQDETGTDQWSPTISVGPTNTVAATWYDRRQDSLGNWWFDYYGAFSGDGGMTWLSDIRITDDSSPVAPLLPNFDPLVLNCYHGDYDQQVQAVDSIYVQWSNDVNVQNLHADPDAWFARYSLAPDFTLEVEPDYHDVCKPDQVFSTISVGSFNGYDEPVTLSESSLPTGVNASFSDNPVFPLPGLSIYTLDVSATTAEGLYTVVISGTSLSLTHRVTLTLAVNSVIPSSATMLTPVDGASELPLVGIVFDWAALPEATAYRFQLDDDPAFGSPEVDAVDVRASEYYVFGPFAPLTTHYWRVSASNGCGEGPFSAPFSFTTQAAACILMVDDDQDLPDVQAYYVGALQNLGYTYDVWDTSTMGDPPLAHLSGYPHVIWATGYPWVDTLNAANEAALAGYLDGGGNLFLSSEDYLFEAGLSPFAQHYLGLASYANDVNYTDPVGNAGAPIGDGLGPYVLVPPAGWPGNFYTDEVAGAQPAPFRWLAAGTDNSTTLISDTYKTAFLAWPLEGLADLAARTEVLSETIAWFGGCSASGYLAGYVRDGEMGGANPPCTTAVVYVEPLGREVPVNMATGYYHASLLPGNYVVEATAPGHSWESAGVTVVDGVTTTQDFELWRPWIEITPTGFVSVTVPMGPPVVGTLWITNYGHLPLDYSIWELPWGGALLSDRPLPAITTLRQERDGAAVVEPQLLAEIAAAGESDFFVWLVERADLSPAHDLATKEQKGWYVFTALTAVAERTQAPLRQYLDRQGVAYEPFYIANKVLVRGGDETLLLNLASRPDVLRITANHIYHLDPSLLGGVPDQGPQPDAVEPNIAFIRADQAWALGYDGTGTVMGNNDTGIDETHPALASHYRGCLDPPACSIWDHNYSWWDATGTYPVNPNDGLGHGTYTTGVMVGDDGGVNQIGVAPGARTIHCKALDDSGGGSDVTLTECFQWDLAPWNLSGDNPNPLLSPDALNNSWGYMNGGAPQFKDEIQALHAAGILVEVASGVEGPSCATLRSPADYWEPLTTGSVDPSTGYPGTISAFSSRGPSMMDSTYWFPDVVAPGENIRSSWLGGGYNSMSGTSASGPHATALVALCWDAAPLLRGHVEETIHVITSTVTPLTGQFGSNCGGDYTTGPNHDWGWGSVDALALAQECFARGGLADLPWVWTNPVSGAVPGPGLQPVDVTVWCTETGELSGTLGIAHNDPCREPVAVPLWIHCVCAHGVNVTPAMDARAGEPGATVVYTLTVVNSGTCTDTFDLTLSGHSWPTIAPTTVGPLAPGAGDSLGVVVEIPVDALCGEWDEAVVTVASHFEPGVAVSSVLTTSAGAVYSVTLDQPADLRWGDPGSDVHYFLIVTNSGNCTDTVNISAAATWPTAVVPAVGPLAPGASAGVDITVTVPADAQCGEWDEATVTFASQADGSISTSSLLTTLANAVAGVAVVPPADSQGGDPGATVTYALALTNTGNCSDTFAIVVSGNLWPTAAPPAVGPLQAQEAHLVGVTVTIPGDALPYEFDVAVVTFSSSQGGKGAYVTSTLTTTVNCEAVSGADFVYTPSLPLAGETVVFTGVVAAGTSPLTYTWDFGDGATGMGAVVSHSYELSGTFYVVVTATNLCGVAAKSRFVPVVGEPLIAVFPLRLGAVLSPGGVSVQVVKVVNEGTSNLRWSLVENPAVPWLEEAPVDGVTPPFSTTDVLVTFDAAGLGGGVYATDLEVHSNDPAGFPVEVDTVLTVTEECVPVGEVNFDHWPPNPLVGRPVTFTASAAYGTSPVLYVWDFGDYQAGEGEVVSHIYVAAVTYRVAVTATNACGSDGRARYVTVYGKPIYYLYLPLVSRVP